MPGTIAENLDGGGRPVKDPIFGTDRPLGGVGGGVWGCDRGLAMLHTLQLMQSTFNDGHTRHSA